MSIERQSHLFLTIKLLKSEHVSSILKPTGLLNSDQKLRIWVTGTQQCTARHLPVFVDN